MPAVAVEKILCVGLPRVRGVPEPRRQVRVREVDGQIRWLPVTEAIAVAVVGCDVSRSSSTSATPAGEQGPNHADDCNDLDTILTDVEAHVTRFVAFGSRHRSVAVALWVAHVYAIDAAPFGCLPAYQVCGRGKREDDPVRGAGTSKFGKHGINAISISPSVVFRLRDKVGPVALLLDEIDNTLKNRADDGARRTCSHS